MAASKPRVTLAASASASTRRRWRPTHATLLAAVAVAVLALLAQGAHAQFQCVIDDPAIPGNVYDLTPLTRNDNDWSVTTAVGSTGNATYRLQFCRTLVAPQSTSCTSTNGASAVCETYLSAVNGVGTAPTSLAINSPGDLTLTYNLGTCSLVRAPILCAARSRVSLLCARASCKGTARGGV